MVNHPNRSKKNPRSGHQPAREEVIARRLLAGLTQPASSALVFRSTSYWKKCEAGERNMAPDTWELYLIKTEKLLKQKSDLSTPDAMHSEKCPNGKRGG